MAYNITTPAISMREHLKGFTTVELPLQRIIPVFVENLRRFGPVFETPLSTVRKAIEFITPLKSFTTRFAAIEIGKWTYLITDMKGASCYVEGYAISRTTGCRAIGLMLLLRGRPLKVWGHPLKVWGQETKLPLDKKLAVL